MGTSHALEEIGTHGTSDVMPQIAVAGDMIIPASSFSTLVCCYNKD
jgi:hypothetical protein